MNLWFRIDFKVTSVFIFSTMCVLFSAKQFSSPPKYEYMYWNTDISDAKHW